MNTVNAVRATAASAKMTMEARCELTTRRAAAAATPCRGGRDGGSTPAMVAMRADSAPGRRSRAHAVSAPTPNASPPAYRTHQLKPGLATGDDVRVMTIEAATMPAASAAAQA